MRRGEQGVRKVSLKMEQIKWVFEGKVVTGES